MRVLVTGGTGKLGRELLPRLSEAGHEVAVLTRRSVPPDVPAHPVHGDLSTGEGIEEAIKGCDAVVHAATAGFGNKYSLRWAIFHRANVDVGGTRRLLEAAQHVGIEHFLFTSIVGMDRVPGWPSIYRYFKHKLAAEALVRDASVPWSIIRLTQFHSLLDQVLEWQFRMPGPVFSLETAGQPIAPSDAADVVTSCLAQAPSKDVEFGGPQVLTGREIVEEWRAKQGVKRKAHYFRAPGKLGQAMAEGALTCPNSVAGHITWSEWLSRHS